MRNFTGREGRMKHTHEPNGAHERAGIPRARGSTHPRIIRERYTRVARTRIRVSPHVAPIGAFSERQSTWKSSGELWGYPVSPGPNRSPPLSLSPPLLPPRRRSHMRLRLNIAYYFGESRVLYYRNTYALLRRDLLNVETIFFYLIASKSRIMEYIFKYMYRESVCVYSLTFRCIFRSKYNIGADENWSLRKIVLHDFFLYKVIFYPTSSWLPSDFTTVSTIEANLLGEQCRLILIFVETILMSTIFKISGKH